MLTTIKAWIARRVAGPELDRLERIDIAISNARQWMAEFPEAAAVLDHVRAVGDGHESYAAVSSVREELRVRRAENLVRLRGQAMAEVRRLTEAHDRRQTRARVDLAPVPMAMERRR